LCLTLGIDSVYYAGRYRFPSALPFDLKIHVQKSTNVSAPAQKIRESRGNAQNSIPDVKMNNLPTTFYVPCGLHLLLSFFSEVFPDTRISTPDAAGEEK
jgi:hypothetical protein